MSHVFIPKYNVLMRSLPFQRIKQARMPQFPTTIDDRTFQLASEYVTSIGYNGPVSVSCDDMKLHPGLKTYWDATKMCHFIVGTVGEPVPVINEHNIREQVADAKQDAASKVCN